MIDLHTWSTQNARKVSIMLEECGLAYTIKPVNLLKNEQKSSEFLEIWRNGRIPVIVDHLEDGSDIVIGESGAILFYLAEKTGQFLPSSGQARHGVMQWLMWQMSGVGPVFGNLAHFAASLDPDSDNVNPYLRKTMADEPVAYAIQRFLDESLRLLGVLNDQLATQEYITTEYSIADMATFAWVESIWPGLESTDPDLSEKIIHVKNWLDRLAARSAVKKGVEILAYGKDLEERGV
jgi:GST-like protein